MPNHFCSEKMPTIDVAINLIYCRQVQLVHILLYPQSKKHNHHGRATLTLCPPVD